MRITSVDEFYSKVVTDLQWSRFGGGFMEHYRGHGLRSYKLLPGLGRYELSAAELRSIEQCLYEKFHKAILDGSINEVRAPFDKTDGGQIKNSWYTLYQAQHIGLKTRLMDWSISWETSLMSAVEDEKHHGQDGSVWIYKSPDEIRVNADNIENGLMVSDPVEYDNVAMINCPVYLFDAYANSIGDSRRARQNGMFLWQSMEDSLIPMNEQSRFKGALYEIIIDGASKKSIKLELEDRGHTIDWSYVRKDENIDSTIKSINSNCLLGDKT